jgi:hypothetical protein
MEQVTVMFTRTVNKLIDCSKVNEPQQAEIIIFGADVLYDEIRVPNFCNWKVGDSIEVTIRPQTRGQLSN